MVVSRPRRRLGWLGPAIVLVGAMAAAAGVWLMVAAKPRPGAVIEEVVIDERGKLVIRAEQGGDRAFLELQLDGKQDWQALVPPYAGRTGRTGIAWTPTAVSVRVVRGQRDEVFALAMRDGKKLGGIHLAPEHGPTKADATGPLSLTDHVRSYELVYGDGWTQLVGVSLALGTPMWKVELGPRPIEAGGVEGGQVWLQQAGTKRWFNVFTGKEDRSMEKVGPPPTFDWKPGDPLPKPS